VRRRRRRRRLLAVSAPHRVERLLSFRDPFADAGDTGYQAVQGFYALSSGGWFGLGLGASREKWAGGLPEAHTDYIFAIVGEELGLLGTLTVLVLFTVLIYSGVRIAHRATDPFVGLASSAVTAWIAAQAIINMGAVVGLLPITGIPLPLVSFGGSALLATLAAIGMLLAFARRSPAPPRRSGRAPACAAACASPCRPSSRASAPPPAGRCPAPPPAPPAPRRPGRVRRPAGPRAPVTGVPPSPGRCPSSSPAAAPPATSSPALALADALRRRDPGDRRHGPRHATGLEARLVPARGYALAEIPRVPAARAARRPTCCACPAGSPGAVRRTREHLDAVGADVVVGFGGYVALPAYLAARRRRTPFVVHEANARAGLANRVGARLTPHVAAAVAGSGLAGAVVLGIPLRRAVATLDRAAAREAARAAFGLAPGPVLLVTGGSQGARAVNAAVTGAPPTSPRRACRCCTSPVRCRPPPCGRPSGPRRRPTTSSTTSTAWSSPTPRPTSPSAAPAP
jgi:hypothetical protein